MSAPTHQAAPVVLLYDGFVAVQATHTVPLPDPDAHSHHALQAISAFNVPAFNAVAPAHAAGAAQPFAQLFPFLCILPLPLRIQRTYILYQSGISIHGDVIVKLL